MLTIKGKKGKLYFNSLSYTRTKSDLDPETAKLFGSDNSMTLPPRKAYKMLLFFLLAKIPIQAEKILKFSRAMFWLFYYVKAKCCKCAYAAGESTAGIYCINATQVFLFGFYCPDKSRP